MKIPSEQLSDVVSNAHLTKNKNLANIKKKRNPIESRCLLLIAERTTRAIVFFR